MIKAIIRWNKLSYFRDDEKLFPSGVSPSRMIYDRLSLDFSISGAISNTYFVSSTSLIFILLLRLLSRRKYILKH